MIVYVCIDDNEGTMFNHRRQSQDRVLRERMLEQTGESPIWVTPYTAKQFSADQQAKLTISADSLMKAGRGEYCFAEGEPLAPHEAKIEEVVLCRWNRVYPADTFLDITLPGVGWELTSTAEFQGSSHPKITMETYRKKES